MIDDPGWSTWLLIAVFAGFVVDWLAIAFHWVKVKPLTKISAILLLILWTLTIGNWQVELMLGLLVLAQLFGLAGDVFLLLHDRWFKCGLGAFLVGNLVYLSLIAVRFSEAVRSRPISGSFIGPLLLSLVVWALILAVFYVVIYLPINRKTISPAFGMAVQIYAWVLGTLVAGSLLLALITPQKSGTIWALPAGSALFIGSDAILAYNRFIKKVPQGQLWVRIAYHSAQFLLAWGFLNTF